jgi:hypothetical protein
MPKSFDIRSLVKAREAHSKEVLALEDAIKEAINSAVDGMKIETVCLGENKDDSFNFTIWGKLVLGGIIKGVSKWPVMMNKHSSMQ